MLSSVIRVDFIPPAVSGLAAPLGMMSAPGRTRELDLDLADLRADHDAKLLVSLVGDQELAYLKIQDLVERARSHGIEIRRFPFGDHSTPNSVADLSALVDAIIARAQAGD